MRFGAFSSSTFHRKQHLTTLGRARESVGVAARPCPSWELHRPLSSSGPLSPRMCYKGGMRSPMEQA